MWEYQADIRSIVDGDTLDVRADLGFYTYKEFRIRLKEVDTAEIYGTKEGSEEQERGEVHSQFTKGWVDEGKEQYDGEYPFIIETAHTGKYGRWIAEVRRKCDGERLHMALIHEFGDEVRA